jgi:hypothetical protein
MKRILPIAIGAAVAIVAVTAIKRRETAPLPETPDGTWETDREETKS